MYIQFINSKFCNRALVAVFWRTNAFQGGKAKTHERLASKKFRAEGLAGMESQT